MREANEVQYYRDDEIDLRELFSTLWGGKWIILITTLLFTSAGALYAFQKPNMYQATVLLASTQSEGGSRLGGQLAGLASLAGVNIGGSDANKTTIAKEVLRSRAFLTEFIHRYKLAAPLIAAESWSKSSDEWQYDPDVYNSETEEWLFDEKGKSLKPTDWDLAEKFKKQLSVSENKDNGMITVAVKSLSPVAANQWAEWLVRDINASMRQKDIKEAEASIRYLEKKLSQTKIAGMQQVFYQLIENETRKVMLANSSSDYIFQIIDPSVVPQEKSEPNRKLIIVVALVIGSITGSLIIFLIRVFRPENS